MEPQRYSRDRRPRSDEHGSSVLNLLHGLSCALDVQQQVLRCVVVRKGERFVAIPRLEDERLAQTLAEDLGAREGLRLSLDGGVDGFDVCIVAVDRDEDGLRIETVFLLAEEIRRNKDWVCGLVGDDLRGEETCESTRVRR